jgi:hypothetical protein
VAIFQNILFLKWSALLIVHCKWVGGAKFMGWAKEILFKVVHHEWMRWMDGWMGG